jgi:transcriptional regulator GlxA family with amidase domain
MTSESYILPMTKARRILFIAYPGIELLDIAGPSAVFSAANTLSAKTCYRSVVAAPGDVPVVTQSGITLVGARLDAIRFKASDTLLVVGADKPHLLRAMRDTQLLDTLRKATKRVERFGSICTGTFLLAAAGLLEGQRVTTHWKGREQLARISDRIRVEQDALYIRDGRLWTSAGVASGIDMALAMVEMDHSSRLKSSISRQLVVYAHRPGYQSQFSELLCAQVKGDDRYTRLVDWLAGRLDQVTKVSEMAAFLAMPERSF